MKYNFNTMNEKENENCFEDNAVKFCYLIQRLIIIDNVR